MLVGLLVPLAPPSASTAAGAEGSDWWPPWYEEWTASAGIDHYYPGDGIPSPPYLLAGGGVCWGDFDGDGFEDLFLTNSVPVRESERRALDTVSRLYANRGDGTFEDVSEGSGVSFQSKGLGCSVADYDGDGDLDLHYTGYGSSSLFRNDARFRFTNVTAASGTWMEGRCGGLPCFSTGAAWADVNRDGCLDLYVVNYGEEDLQYPVLAGWDGQANVYFESRCDGTFWNATAERRLTDDPSWEHSRSFMPQFCDYDQDGLLDVYVASDETRNSLLRQLPDGTFVDVAAEAGVDDWRGSMGLEFDDLDGDGWCDLYMTHHQGEGNGLYVNNRNGTFRDRSREGDLMTGIEQVGWGAAFVDFDNDGRKDVYAVNGHTFYDPEFANMTLNFYRQREDGSFKDVTKLAGQAMKFNRTSRGSAWADFDLDGDVDFAIVNVNNQTATLLRATGVSGGWLAVEVRDEGSANRFGVGARVAVEPSAAPRQTRLVQAGGSFLSQNSYNLHFGLDASASATLTVRWPDGETQTFADVPANRIVRVVRGASSLEEDVLAPVPRAAVVGPTHAGESLPRVALDAEDRGVTRVSGVDRIEYRVDGGAWTRYETPFVVADGARVVEYRAFDRAGNSAAPRALDVTGALAAVATGIADAPTR